MAMARDKNIVSKPVLQEALSKITIKGFKSLSSECCFEVRPLTVLAGANSSGKSSAVQPLLLFKQTLEATFDPGTLLIAGPNVSFSSRDQLVSRGSDDFSVEMETESGRSMSNLYRKDAGGFINARMSYRIGNISVVLMPGMDSASVVSSVLPLFRERWRSAVKVGDKELDNLLKALFKKSIEDAETDIWRVERKRCFLSAASSSKAGFTNLSEFGAFESALENLIHVPALRGNPARSYRTSAVGSSFPGVFDNYVASILHSWQRHSQDELGQLEECLHALQLAWRIEAVPLDDIQVELRVPRMPGRSKNGRTEDWVSVADVGFGLSQALPVVLALITAQSRQMVYVEQPEIHLHPRAQAKLAELLVKAANRGVRVIAETHSENLLLGIQTCVAEGKIDPGDVKLHWFTRGKDGVTRISSADLDEAGAFGDWPEDFADVALSAQRRYLDASEKKLRISSK